MKFAPLQGLTAEAVLDRHPDLRDIDSLILMERTAEQERTSARSEAVIRIGKYLGGPWGGAASILRLVPHPIRDWGYAFFARHRYRVFSRYEVCPNPPPEGRQRFLP